MGKTSKHHKATHKKTRRTITKNYTETLIVLMFLRMLNTVKLYHWKTFSYAQHKATDELYASLNTHISIRSASHLLNTLNFKCRLQCEHVAELVTIKDHAATLLNFQPHVSRSSLR